MEEHINSSSWPGRADGSTGGVGPRVAGERSIGEILKGMVDNIGEIVRCEIRLAKADTQQFALTRWPSVRLVMVGAACALFGTGYLLSSVVYALAILIPLWAASACVGLVLAMVATAMINAGLGHWRRLSVAAQNPKVSSKEEEAWSKQQAT